MTYGKKDFGRLDIDKLTTIDFLNGIEDAAICGKNICEYFKKLNEEPPTIINEIYDRILSYEAEIKKLIAGPRFTKKLKKKAFGLIISAQLASVDMTNEVYKYAERKGKSFQKGKDND